MYAPSLPCGTICEPTPVQAQATVVVERRRSPKMSVSGSEPGAEHRVGFHNHPLIYGVKLQRTNELPPRMKTRISIGGDNNASNPLASRSHSKAAAILTDGDQLRPAESGETPQPPKCRPHAIDVIGANPVATK